MAYKSGRYISCKNDIMFKALFVRNEDILKQFISDMLDIPFKEITGMKILNSEIIPRDLPGKTSRLDVHLIIGNKEIDIEMQARRERDFADRVLLLPVKAVCG